MRDAEKQLIVITVGIMSYESNIFDMLNSNFVMRIKDKNVVFAQRKYCIIHIFDS